MLALWDVHKCMPCLNALFEALEKFWDRFRHTDFFKQHPVLSDPVTCLQ